METEDYKQAARKMLQTYGKEAQRRARRRARALQAAGDETGYALWMRVYRAIDQLRFCGSLPRVG